jgi:hypothetical protein
MVDLPVWHSLSPRAVVAYLELARRFNGTNNGTVPTANPKRLTGRRESADTRSR